MRIHQACWFVPMKMEVLRTEVKKPLLSQALCYPKYCGCCGVLCKSLWAKETKVETEMVYWNVEAEDRDYDITKVVWKLSLKGRIEVTIWCPRNWRAMGDRNVREFTWKTWIAKPQRSKFLETKEGWNQLGCSEECFRISSLGRNIEMDRRKLRKRKGGKGKCV